MPKEYLNPPELFPSLQYGFSQIVTSTGGTLVFLSGQVAWNEKQQIIGEGDLEAQSWQTFKNIEVALRAAGGSLTDIVSIRIYIVEGKLEESHFISEVLQAHFAQDNAPATTWIGVRALARPEFLVEMEVTAVIE